MTFLRNSDVKNHLYTGSGPKHHLVSGHVAAGKETVPAVAAQPDSLDVSVDSSRVPSGCAVSPVTKAKPAV